MDSLLEMMTTADPVEMMIKQRRILWIIGLPLGNKRVFFAPELALGITSCGQRMATLSWSRNVGGSGIDAARG